ncbi:MAG: hypothetical protein U0176_25135 [Bacteroidia bacterium]
MRTKSLVLWSLILVFGGAGLTSKAVVVNANPSVVAMELPGGGGDDKEKKEKKGGKGEKDESTKDAKTRDVSSKPQQHARLSAKTAKQTTKYTQKEIMGRAKVRLFFHNTFNTKYGRPVNFRSTGARNRWSKGRRW